ncbi:MAG: sugar phosphate nucleotidyltransferase [Gemmatimonadota bacterium]
MNPLPIQPGTITKAVILAAGLGTRMRKDEGAVALSAAQQQAADAGIKGLVPVGRPFLDYTLSGLADAGYRDICLVIGPEHQAVRAYYQSHEPARITISFAIQQQPKGTADAVASAEAFVGTEQFLVLNSDNHYPAPALIALRHLDNPGLVAFRVDALLASGIPYARIARFPVMVWDQSGQLVEMQTGSIPCATDFVSMNCWRFSPGIFEACRSIAPAPSGELELPDAVRYTMDPLGERFSVLPFALPVLDLSTRADIAHVTEELRNVEVIL